MDSRSTKIQLSPEIGQESTSSLKTATYSGERRETRTWEKYTADQRADAQLDKLNSPTETNNKTINIDIPSDDHDDVKTSYSYESDEETSLPSDFQTRRSDIRSDITGVYKDRSNDCPTQEDDVSVFSYDSDEDRCLPIGNTSNANLNFILADINAERGNSKCMNSDFIKNDSDFSDDDDAVTVDAYGNHADDGNAAYGDDIEDDVKTTYSYESDEQTNLPSDFQTWRSDIRSDIRSDTIDDINKDRSNDCPTPEDKVSVFSYDSDEDRCVPIGNRPKSKLNAILADINVERGHSNCMNSDFIKNDFDLSDDDDDVDDDDDTDNDNAGYDEDSDGMDFDIYDDSDEGVAVGDDDNDDTDEEEDCDDYAEGETGDLTEETNAIIKEAIRDVVAKYLGNSTKDVLFELDTDVTDNVCKDNIADENNCLQDDDDDDDDDDNDDGDDGGDNAAVVRGNNNDNDDTKADADKNCIIDNDDTDDTDDDDDTVRCNYNATYNDTKATTDDDDTDNGEDDTDDDIKADADNSCLIVYDGSEYSDAAAAAAAAAADDDYNDDAEDVTKANVGDEKTHNIKEKEEGVEKEEQEGENGMTDISLIVPCDRINIEDVNRTKSESHLPATDVPTLGSGEESFVSVLSSLYEDEESDAGPAWIYLEDNKGYVCVGDFAATVKPPPLQNHEDEKNDDRSACCCFPFSKKRNRKTGLFARIFSRLRVFNRKNT